MRRRQAVSGAVVPAWFQFERNHPSSGEDCLANCVKRRNPSLPPDLITRRSRIRIPPPAIGGRPTQAPQEALLKADDERSRSSEWPWVARSWLLVWTRACQDLPGACGRPSDVTASIAWQRATGATCVRRPCTTKSPRVLPATSLRCRMSALSTRGASPQVSDCRDDVVVPRLWSHPADCRWPRVTARRPEEAKLLVTRSPAGRSRAGKAPTRASRPSVRAGTR